MGLETLERSLVGEEDDDIVVRVFLRIDFEFTVEIIDKFDAAVDEDVSSVFPGSCFAF